MQKNNSVIFKGVRDNIVIILSQAASFEEISQALRSKLRDSSKFFTDDKTTIAFKGKKVSEAELISLIDIINEETDLSISFVEDLTGTFDVVKERRDEAAAEKKLKSLEELAMEGALFHRSGLRSGQKIEYSGSVVILGDVNAGAEVIAVGNVVVFGAIRGLVHAGSQGNEKAFVCALSMLPTQLRIADRKTYFPDDLIKKNKNKIDPVYAYVKGEEIYVVSITN